MLPGRLQGSQYWRFTIQTSQIPETMFQSRRLSKKIRGQGQKNVTSRTVPTDFTKLLVIFYGLIKMTAGCHSLESEPENNKKEKQYREMEAGLVDAIIQLQQFATPPPLKPTSVTKIPMFQTNDERIHSILHSFINKTLNKQAEEKEETPNASGLTKQQEMIYATE
jgi:hypothetical protein